MSRPSKTRSQMSPISLKNKSMSKLLRITRNHCRNPGGTSLANKPMKPSGSKPSQANGAKPSQSKPGQAKVSQPNPKKAEPASQAARALERGNQAPGRRRLSVGAKGAGPWEPPRREARAKSHMKPWLLRNLLDSSQ